MRCAIMVMAALCAASAAMVSGEEVSAIPPVLTADLATVQFLFAEEGGWFCSTNWQPMRSVREAVDDAVDVSRLEHHLPGPAPLPPDVEKIALEQLRQDRGAWFIGFSLRFEAPLLLRLSGVALEPTGDGRYSGFLGRFEGVPKADPEDRVRPVGLCFPIDEIRKGGRIQALVKSTQVEQELAAAIGIELRERFGADMSSRNLKKIADGSSSPLYVGEITKADNAIVLFALALEQGKLMRIPFFNPKSNSEESAFLIEDPNPDNDVAMYDTAYSYLADMDGNGLPELFICSTVSYFFTLEQANGALRWRMVNTYYRGP